MWLFWVELAWSEDVRYKVLGIGYNTPLLRANFVPEIPDSRSACTEGSYDNDYNISKKLSFNMAKLSLSNRKAGMTHVCSPIFVLFLLILESLSLVSWNCCNSVVHISMLSKSHYFVVYNVSTCWSVYSPNVALLCDVCVRRRCVVAFARRNWMFVYSAHYAEERQSRRCILFCCVIGEVVRTTSLVY